MKGPIDCIALSFALLYKVHCGMELICQVLTTRVWVLEKVRAGKCALTAFLGWAEDWLSLWQAHYILSPLLFSLQQHTPCFLVVIIFQVPWLMNDIETVISTLTPQSTHPLMYDGWSGWGGNARSKRFCLLVSGGEVLAQLTSLLSTKGEQSPVRTHNQNFSWNKSSDIRSFPLSG